MRRRLRQGTCRASARAGIVLQLAGCSDFFLSRKADEVADPMRVTETFSQAPLPRVDLLWVIDDTPSMAGEHAALAAGMPGFATELESAGVAWQVGVVTTDPDDAPGVLRGDPWVMTPIDGSALASLLDTAGITLTGAEPASGLGAMVLALEEPLRSGANQGFRRPGAALHVIVVSDGNDNSQTLLGEDPVWSAISLLEDEERASGQAARLSAIVGPEGGCSGRNGTALPGTDYLAVAEASGGSVDSVCEADLDGLVSNLGATSIEWQRVFPLQA
ncbi:MAG: hypothetical protein VX265_01085, partial [Myxococcota bacterium]|nr:hypothetical protein [Myxococcota bacterium]